MFKPFLSGLLLLIISSVSTAFALPKDWPPGLSPMPSSLKKAVEKRLKPALDKKGKPKVFLRSKAWKKSRGDIKKLGPREFYIPLSVRKVMKQKWNAPFPVATGVHLSPLFSRKAFLLRKVHQDSFAGVLGIQSGDILKRINNIKVFADSSKAISSVQNNCMTTLAVERKGKVLLWKIHYCSKSKLPSQAPSSRPASSL